MHAHPWKMSQELLSICVGCHLGSGIADRIDLTSLKSFLLKPNDSRKKIYIQHKTHFDQKVAIKH